MVDKPMPNFGFRMMSFFFKVRDTFNSPRKTLEEVGIEQGQSVLDYGCGPAGYTFAAAKIVGSSGRVYGADIHPLAAKKIRNVAKKKKLDNVEAITTDCHTGLADECIDVVLLYDILHVLSESNRILSELHRVLVDKGKLSVSDHHMKPTVIVEQIEGTGLFKQTAEGKKTISFSKCVPEALD